MEISLDNIEAKNIIQKYENNVITISNKQYSDSFILMPNEIIPKWQIQSLAKLSLDSIHQILEYSPEVLILASNEKNLLPKAKFVSKVMQQGLGFEFMNIHAACRTYSILAADRRKVAVAFIIKQV